MSDYQRLAAFAVIRELYDQNKSMHDVLCEFVFGAICSQSLYFFTADSMRSALENEYGIVVPRAVVDFVLRSLSKKNRWCSSSGKDYSVSGIPEGISSNITEKYNALLRTNESICAQLVDYANCVYGNQLSQDEEIALIKSFCAFLLNEKSANGNAQLVSSFILQREGESDFQKKIDEIREGVVIYSGITYNEKPFEVGSWKSELTFYLDQEILFHSYGLNGDIFQGCFNDFHDLVKEINVAAKKKLIRLKYFPETKDEIDAFYSYAERIVRGAAAVRPGNTAMRSIVNGCTSPSDVIEKQTRFYKYLENIGIVLDQEFVYDERKFPHNIINQEIYDTVRNDEGEKACGSLSILNKVHCLRGSLGVRDFYDVKFHFITGTEATIRAAWHPTVKGSEAVPLATSLDWVTNRFWYKLNKRFDGGNAPLFMQAITKSKIVLSALANRNVGETYDKLLVRHEEGELSKEIVQAGIYELMEKTVNPEDINMQSASRSLDFLSLDSIEHFKAEHDAAKIRQEEQLQEIESLRRENDQLKSTKQRQEALNELSEVGALLASKLRTKKKADRIYNAALMACLLLLVTLQISSLYSVYYVFSVTKWEELAPMIAKYKMLIEILSIFLPIAGFSVASIRSLRSRFMLIIKSKIYAWCEVRESDIGSLAEQKKRIESFL